jgi:hypothetical protein
MLSGADGMMPPEDWAGDEWACGTLGTGVLTSDRAKGAVVARRDCRTGCYLRVKVVVVAAG